MAEVVPAGREVVVNLMIEAAEVVAEAAIKEVDQVTTLKWVSTPNNNKEKSLSLILSRELKLI